MEATYLTLNPQSLNPSSNLQKSLEGPGFVFVFPGLEHVRILMQLVRFLSLAFCWGIQ